MDLSKKSWSSLSQLKTFIEKNSVKEKVLSFNGYELVTNKGLYGMFDGTVTFESTEDTTIRLAEEAAALEKAKARKKKAPVKPRAPQTKKAVVKKPRKPRAKKSDK